MHPSCGLNETLVQCIEVDGTEGPSLEVFSTIVNISIVQFGRFISNTIVYTMNY